MKSTMPRVGIIDNKRAELLEGVALLSLTLTAFDKTRGSLNLSRHNSSIPRTYE